MEEGDPRHVAFIMDGNGRWAEVRGLPRALGHREGVETVRRVITHARKLGIPYLTLYAFSTENWSRPRAEVKALMLLLAQYIDGELPTMRRNDISLRLIGDAGGLSAGLRRKLNAAIAATAGNRSLVLTLAINYGGRDEIVRACRAACADLAREGRGPEELDADRLSARLDTAGMPDPDLVIRTAGEMRLSNFLIWQAAYAEFVFCRRAWPDFSDGDFDDALREYRGRKRKFGGE